MFLAYLDYLEDKEMAEQKAMQTKIVYKVGHRKLLDFHQCLSHIVEFNEYLSKVNDESIEILLKVVLKNIIASKRKQGRHKCIFYYPMTPLNINAYINGLTNIDYFEAKTKTRYFRLDTVDIDRVIFVMPMRLSLSDEQRFLFHERLSKFQIMWLTPESVFDRYQYRQNQNKIIISRMKARDEIKRQNMLFRSEIMSIPPCRERLPSLLEEEIENSDYDKTHELGILRAYLPDVVTPSNSFVSMFHDTTKLNHDFVDAVNDERAVVSEILFEDIDAVDGNLKSNVVSDLRSNIGDFENLDDTEITYYDQKAQNELIKQSLLLNENNMSSVDSECSDSLR